MSFLGSLFSGASNNFNPIGSEQAQTNYNQAGTGLNDLAQQLKLQSQGGGPNLANQLLQNATGQNVANQAALMAGQRGAAQNVGLMARQAAQQGAGIQQQAAGQAAANRMQQQLAAQSQLGGVLQAQGQLGSSVLNANNKIGADVSAENNKSRQGMLSGIGSMAGALIPGIGQAAMGMLGGGGQDARKVAADANYGLAEGGAVQQQQPMPASWQQNFLMGAKPQAQPQMMAEGGLPFMPHDYRSGGDVQAHSPKEQATKPGNSYANDKIPAMLSEGEIVIPRDVVQTGNPQAAAQFVSQVMSGKHRKSK